MIAKLGVPPELIIDLLALMGDKVDNILGVAVAKSRLLLYCSILVGSSRFTRSWMR